MKVGTYVKQNVLKGTDIYRYGIIVNRNFPVDSHVREVYDSMGEVPVKVVFTPHKTHPVSTQPYSEVVPLSKLEVVSG